MQDAFSELPLTTPQRAALAAIGVSPAALLVLLLMLEGRPFSSSAAAQVFDCTQVTIRRHLAVLQSSGLVVGAGHAASSQYYLTGLAAGLMLSVPIAGLAPAGAQISTPDAPAPAPAGAQISTPDGAGPASAGAGAQIWMPDAPAGAQIWTPDGALARKFVCQPSSGEVPSYTATTALIKDLKHKAAVSSSASLAAQNWPSGGPEAQISKLTAARPNPRLIRARAALQAAGVGITPSVRALMENDWMTAEYIRYHTQRLRDEKRLSPALLLTVLRTHDPAPGLERQRRSRSPYRLPRSVFRRVERPARARQPEPEPEPEPEPDLEPTPAGDPRFDQPCPECHGRSPNQVWASAILMLSKQMAVHTYRNYLEPCRLLDCDLQDGPRFTLVAPTAFARDWCADRLTNLLRRTLAADCGVDVQVVFLAPADV